MQSCSERKGKYLNIEKAIQALCNQEDCRGKLVVHNVRFVSSEEQRRRRQIVQFEGEPRESIYGKGSKKKLATVSGT